MTTTRVGMLVGLAAALEGCVIYEHDRRWDDCDRGGSCWTSPSEHETGAPVVPEPVYGLELAPNQGTAGTILIVSATTHDDLDLQEVTALSFEDGVVLLAWEARDDELLLSVEIPHDTVPGPYDVLVTLPDGEIVSFADHFLVLPAEMDDPEDTGGGETEDPCPDTGA